ncbi:MAG: hypothetical protein AAGU11_12030 [Syntrophobacteraceae bacterium]
MTNARTSQALGSSFLRGNGAHSAVFAAATPPLHLPVMVKSGGEMRLPNLPLSRLET